jgi:Pyridine nucleotide-disulphide oxidoreductase
VSAPRIVVVGGGAGSAAAGVCYLRTLRDAAELRDRIGAAGHVAVLGGGFIGCEVASAAIQPGKRATILEALPTLHRPSARTWATSSPASTVRRASTCAPGSFALDVRRLIARGHRATAEQLRDESLPLKRLASPAAPVP